MTGNVDVDHSGLRLREAERLMTSYAARPGVRWICVAGSAARGLSDASSDLDCIVVWDDIDHDFLDGAPLEAEGGTRFTDHRNDDDSGRIEQYQLDSGLKVDVGSSQYDSWVTLVEDVLVRHEVDWAKSKIAGGTLDAHVVHGGEHLRPWQARIADYPDALREKAVRHHLRFYPAWALGGLGAARGELLTYMDLLTKIVGNLLGVCAALNRVYWVAGPEPKWVRWYTAKMPLAPPDLADRIDRWLTDPSDRSVADVASAIAETLDLVARELPGIDLTRTRAVQDLAPTAWP